MTNHLSEKGRIKMRTNKIESILINDQSQNNNWSNAEGTSSISQSNINLINWSFVIDCWSRYSQFCLFSPWSLGRQGYLTCFNQSPILSLAHSLTFLNLSLWGVNSPLDGSTYPRWKVICFSLMKKSLQSNATSQDKCCHLSAEGARLATINACRSVLYRLRTKIMLIRGRGGGLLIE